MNDHNTVKSPLQMTCFSPVALLAGVLLVTSVLLSGCGQPVTGASSDSSPTTSSSTVSTHVPVMLASVATLPPQDSNPITLLVGDPSGAGAWFMDNQGSTADALYHVSATGALTAYPVSNVGGQARDGLAVGKDGMVWFGVNTTLIELDSHTGKTQQWSIPAFRANASMQHLSANDPAGARAVDALAVGPDGRVAISMNNQSAVVEFDPSTARFSALNLPLATDKVLSVTYSGDGSLCVGMANLAIGGHATELLLLQTDGATAHATVPDGTAWEVGPYSASTFIVGSFSPHLVSSSGVVTKVPAPAALQGSAAAPTPLQVLPSGDFVGIASHALVEFPSKATSSVAATTKASLLALPKVACQQGTFAGVPANDPTPTPYPPGSMCPGPMSDVLSVDGAGNLWVVSPYAQAGVAILKPSTSP